VGLNLPLVFFAKNNQHFWQGLRSKVFVQLTVVFSWGINAVEAPGSEITLM
jgi:hypothetical protein